jgi:7-carboxy-7-deazaguanine synthase
MRVCDYQLKFVIESPADLDEVEEIAGEIEADASRVVLMPEGTRREIILERALWLAELCKEKGYRYSPRLHIDLWGDKRGV